MSELLIVDIISRPASELIVLMVPERIGTPSITYSGELLALKEPIPRIRTGVHLNGDYKNTGVCDFHYRPFTLEAEPA